MSSESLSKKWKQAVKDNLFTGSFKEFAEQYNQNMFAESENHYNDLGTADSSTVQKGDLTPIDVSKVNETKVLGMTPQKLLIVGGVATAVTIAGIFLLIRALSKEEE
jgi:hypothetical protein